MRINQGTIPSAYTRVTVSFQHSSDGDGLQRQPLRLNDLRGRGDRVGICDDEYTVWRIGPPTATEMPSEASGKLCTNDLKEMSAYKRM